MLWRQLAAVLAFLSALLAVNEGIAFSLSGEAVTDAEFLELCASGTAQEIAEALDAGANLYARDSEGMTGLMYAVEKNPNPMIVPILLEEGISVNSRGGRNTTVLMTAARANRNPGIIAILLSAGANVDARDEDGMTVLMYAAAFNKNPDIISVLLDAGADIDARTGRGMTALMFAAAMNSNPEVIATLVEGGANVNAQDEGGRMAVGYARDNDNLLAFEIALRHRRNRQLIDVLIRSAERGDADSQYQLGLMYARGEGVSVDQWKAIQWFRRAKAQGFEPARYELIKRGFYH
ncbi:MAG: ankyrin repeat domain-containing protein [Fretibacterium sp.]|nr:ankyrin repeat domain-containing protein [Fretibacterium sp.]